MDVSLQMKNKNKEYGDTNCMNLLIQQFLLETKSIPQKDAWPTCRQGGGPFYNIITCHGHGFMSKSALSWGISHKVGPKTPVISRVEYLHV